MELSVGKALFLCGVAVTVIWFSNPVSDFYYQHIASHDDIERIVAHAWDATIESPKDNDGRFRSIAVGTNGAIDVIVKGPMLLRKMGANEEIERKIRLRDNNFVNNLNNLLEVFTYFFSKGAGGERFMNDKELFTKAVAISKAMPRTELYIGGNAALMAQTIVETSPKDVRVLYGGSVGPDLRSLLHPRIIIPQSAKSEDDEFHIIMEYGKGEKWAGHICPIASRFIFSHDFTNGQMLVLERFVKSLDEFGPDLVVLSGLHMMESQPPSFWNRRFAEIASALSSIPRKIPIHLELASMANTEFVKILTERIFPVINSVGLNEQELWLVCQTSGGPHCTSNGEKVSLNGPPTTGVSNDIIFWMLETFSSLKHPISRLDRVHFHTLTHHTLATLQSSRWLYGNASVAAGTRIASTQSCGDVTVQPEKVGIRLNKTISLTAGGLGKEINLTDETFDCFNPVLSWSVSKINFHLSPVLVCKEPVKTVGLGDAISSNSLIHSGFKKN